MKRIARKTEAASARVLEDLGEQPLDRIDPSARNPRGLVKPEDVHDLADSIRVHGVLNPLLVMRRGPRLEVIAGSRRLAAARAAGLATVPCRAYRTDAPVGLVTAVPLERAAAIVENDQRQRVQPLAEARAVLLLVEEGASHADVARALGRSEGWVRRRAGLCTLSKRVLDAEWVHAREWPIEWLEDLASVAPDVQERLAKHELVGIQSREQLQEVLFAATSELGAAPWDLDDAKLDPRAGSCRACPKRSAVAPGLFELVERKNGADRCLDAPCFRAKLAKHRARILGNARKEHGAVLAVHGIKRWGQSGVRMPGPALEPDRYERVGAKAKGAKAAVVVDGKRSGQVIHVRVLAAPKVTPMREPAAPSAEKQTEGQALSHAVAEVQRIFGAVKRPSLEATVVLAAAYGSAGDSYVDRIRGRGDSREARLARKPDAAAAALWEEAQRAIENALEPPFTAAGSHSWLEQLKERAQEAELVADFFDRLAPKGEAPFDWKAILEHSRKAAAMAAKPTEEKEAKRGKGKN